MSDGKYRVTINFGNPRTTDSLDAEIARLLMESPQPSQLAKELIRVGYKLVGGKK